MKISTRRPQDVAYEVEALVRQGRRHFVLTSIDHGGMLDLERLGAARYAAGIHCRVELESREAVLSVR